MKINPSIAISQNHILTHRSASSIPKHRPSLPVTFRKLLFTNNCNSSKRVRTSDSLASAIYSVVRADQLRRIPADEPLTHGTLRPTADNPFIEFHADSIGTFKSYKKWRRLFTRLEEIKVSGQGGGKFIVMGVNPLSRVVR